MGKKKKTVEEKEGQTNKKPKSSPKVQFEKTNTSSLWLTKGLVESKPTMQLRKAERKYTTFIKYKMKDIEHAEFPDQIQEWHENFKNFMRELWRKDDSICLHPWNKKQNTKQSQFFGRIWNKFEISNI